MKEVRTGLEAIKELLDKKYITATGALFFTFLQLRVLGISELDSNEVMRILRLSKTSFYRAKKAIERENWLLERKSIYIPTRRDTGPKSEQ